MPDTAVPIDIQACEAAPFGPFRDDCSPTERVRMLGLLEAFAHTYGGGHPDVPDALKRAAFGGDTELAAGWLALQRLPTIPRRRVLASFAARTRAAGRAV